MKIQKIEIEQFGGLKNFTLDFFGGAQYIYGENEAGKSTLCAFVAAMFYGLPAKVRGGGLRGDSRSLYMPWGETYMAGTLHFEAEGKNYVLTRRFGQTARGDKTSLMLESDWQEVPIHPDEIGQHFLGVGEEAFYKTLFISQLGAAFEKGKEDELMTRLSNLETSGDEDASVLAALAELERARHRLVTKTGRGGLIVQLDDEIEALKTELLEAKQRHYAFRSLLSDVQQMTQEKDLAEKELATINEKRKMATKYAEYQKNLQRIVAKKELSEGIASEKERLVKLQEEKKALLSEKEKAGFVLKLESDTIVQLAEKEAACTVLEKELQQQVELSSEIEKLTEELSQKKAKKISVPLLSVTAFFAALTIVLGVLLSPFFFGLTLVFLAGVAFGIKGGTDKEWLALSAKLSEKQESLSRKQEEKTKEKLDALQKELQAVFEKAGVSNLSALTEKIESAKALVYKLDAIEQEENRTSEGIKSKEEELAGMPETEEMESVEYTGPTPEELSLMQERLQQKQINRERELAQKNAKVENGFSGTRSASVIESALEEAYEQRQKLVEQYEALSLAYKLMEACAEDMKNTFAPALNEKSGRLIAELTGGKYQDVRVTDAYKIMLKTPMGSEIVPAEYVSAGTYDLLYFALRMAVLETLFNDIPFLVLDDAFMQLDDTRQKDAFNWLCNKRTEQVLYFSCHQPPAAWTGKVITL